MSKCVAMFLLLFFDFAKLCSTSVVLFNRLYYGEYNTVIGGLWRGLDQRYSST